MRLHIRNRGVEANVEFRNSVKERLGTALRRFAHYISEVWVYVRAANGPREGGDKKCRIVAYVPGAGRVVVEGTDAEIHTAVRRTSDRARFAVKRHLKRRRALRRRPRHSARRLAVVTKSADRAGADWKPGPG